VQPRTRVVHQAAKWAADQNKFDEFNIAVFSTFFEHGKDISDHVVLINIANDLDLNITSLQNALLGNNYIDKIEEDMEMAKQIGITAVPSFVINGKRIGAGVQPVSRLQELIEISRENN
jgi:predicted DsbA family dithiol-disulfide isomerase